MVKQFIYDMIHLTDGEQFIKYWWLWLIWIVLAFIYVVIKYRKVK